MSGDPCECVFNHEAIMRRILSILQDAQADCTDTECSTGTGGDPAGGSNMLLIAMAWGLFATMMFLMRPASMRSGNGRDNEGQAASKPTNTSGGSGNNNDNDRSPPPGDVF